MSMTSIWQPTSPRGTRTPAQTPWWGRRSSSAWSSWRPLGRSTWRSWTRSRGTSWPASGESLGYCYNYFTVNNICSYHWPNGVLYYTIDAAFDSTERATIAAGMKMVEDNSCIRFKPITFFWILKFLALKVCSSHHWVRLCGHHPWRRRLLRPGPIQDGERQDGDWASAEWLRLREGWGEGGGGSYFIDIIII